MIQKSFGKRKRILCIISDDRPSRVMGTLVPENPQRIRPLGDSAVDQAVFLQFLKAFNESSFLGIVFFTGTFEDASHHYDCRSVSLCRKTTLGLLELASQ